MTQALRQTAQGPAILAAILGVAVLVSCQSTPGADQPPSPLPLPGPPMQAISPLMEPPRVGAPSAPVVLRNWAYLPNVSALAFEDCAHNRRAAAMLALIANAEWQNRKIIRCHPLLSNAAQAKTDAMAAGGWASHISPQGVSPNDNVRAHGFPLPDYYPVGGNSVESFAAGFAYSDPVIVLAAFATSPLHWRHLSAGTPEGPEPFFVNQECLAVGYSQTFGVSFVHFWVVLSAPCP